MEDRFVMPENQPPTRAELQTLLRAEFAEMELRMTKWVASADTVKLLDNRVTGLEGSRIAREHLASDVLSLEHKIERIDNEMIGRAAVRRFVVAGVGIVALLNGIALGLVAYLNG